jgi:calpain-7
MFLEMLRIPWRDVCDVFQSLYVSWDPALFQYQLSFHGSEKLLWSTSSPNLLPDYGSQTILKIAIKVRLLYSVSWCLMHWMGVVSSRKLCLTLNHGETVVGTHDVWILLARHISDSLQMAEYISLQVESVDSLARQLDIDRLSLKVQSPQDSSRFFAESCARDHIRTVHIYW